jgi:hypothetical protein
LVYQSNGKTFFYQQPQGFFTTKDTKFTKEGKSNDFGLNIKDFLGALGELGGERRFK